MLVILNDPTGVTGIKRHPFDLSVSLQANIELHISGGSDAELRINGQKVDPLVDPRLDMAPFRDDLVTIALRPKGWETLIAFVAENWIAIAATTLSLYSLTVKPPSLGGVDSAGNDSPNNRLSSQTNQARTYQAIPDVYGYRRVWPDLIQPSVVEYRDHVKYVTETMCISRGTGSVSDVRYSNTPVSEIDGASFEVFYPSAFSLNPPYFSNYVEHGATTVYNVYETFQSDDVNGQELPYLESTGTAFNSATATFVATSGSPVFTITSPYTADMVVLRNIAGTGTPVGVLFDYSAATFNANCTVLSFSVPNNVATITFQATSNFSANYSESLTAGILYTPSTSTTYAVVGPFTLPKDSDRLWWNLVFLRGLQGSVDIRAEFWQVDGAGVEISGTRQVVNRTYTDYTYDQRFYTEKITPTAGNGRYRIQFERRSAQVDANGADVCKLEEVYAVRYYANKDFPGCSIIRVTTKATTAAIGFSDRKFNLWWARQIRDLSSESISASRNFGRILAHVWCIAGNDISGLDVDSIADINAEFGETSDLLRFDGSLDDANMSLGERMQLIADHARCIIWRDGAKWFVRRNQAQQYPVLQLDYLSLASGGESSINYSGHLPASFDGVEVEYVDELAQSKKAYVRLNISTGTPVVGIGANMKKVQMLGCATETQATNRAYFEANRLIYQRTTVSDTALSDVWAHGPGALVRWVDPNEFGGELQAGEVMSLAGSVITTSEPLDFAGYSSGRIVFTGEYGQRLGSPVVCTPGTGDSVTLASVPSGVYVADDNRQCGSRYAFAVGLTAAELDAAGLYLIADVKPGSDGTASVSLINYDERFYAAD